MLPEGCRRCCLLFTVLTASSQHVFANFSLLTKRLACKPRFSLRTTFLALQTGTLFSAMKAVSIELHDFSSTPSLSSRKRWQQNMNN